MWNILTVNQVLGLSARMLRKDDMAHAFLFIPPPSNAHLDSTLDTNSYEYKLFLTAINNVCEDLTTQYPLLCFEEKFFGNKIKYDDLVYRIAKVIEIRDSKGKKARFYRSSDGVLLPSTDNYTILYSYKPDKLVENEFVPLYPTVPETILAYGVCAQYTLMDGLFDEADLWESKYKEALLAHFRHTKNIKMRARLWQ